MRLTDSEVAAIRDSAREAFGAEAIVRLFGSRLDDARRGGDIDLHVQAPAHVCSLAASGRFRGLLNQRVGERDYDILVAIAGRPLSAIDRRAIAEGVVL